MSSADTQLRVCTLNCWGLKYIAKDRTERIAAIAQALANADYDIVALQELWVSADYALVRSSVAKRLPYAKYFYSGAIGAGLALFSRFPIIGATIHSYSLNGSPLDVAGGDWFAGKAVASILVLHPVLGELQVFNTHLFAKGGESGATHLQAHRLVNAWEFAKLARQSAELGRYVVAMGDFNSVPTALALAVIRDHAQLTDAWSATHPNEAPQEHGLLPTPREALALHGVTADSPLNTYSAGKPLEPYAREFQGKRLDYVFFRAPARPHGPGHAPQLTARAAKVVFTEKVPHRDFSFSDHFGLEATFAIVPPHGAPTPAAASAPPSSPPVSGTARDEGPLGAPFVAASADVPLAAFPDARRPLPATLSHASVGSVVHALTVCYRHSLARSRLYLAGFAACVLVLLVLAVGSAWLPRSWINPLFVLFTVAVSWFGTTLFYVGFVYGRWEVNALMNVIEELEIFKGTIGER